MRIRDTYSLPACGLYYCSIEHIRLLADVRERAKKNMEPKVDSGYLSIRREPLPRTDLLHDNTSDIRYFVSEGTPYNRVLILGRTTLDVRLEVGQLTASNV